MTTTALAPDVFPWLDHSRYTFSLGVSAEGVAVLSGHSASEYDPASGRIVVRGGMSQQTHTAYDKIEAILRSGGLSLQDAVHIVENVSLAGMASYAEAAVVRESRLLGASPTVTTVCADRLLRDTALIEVQVTAVAGGGKPILVEAVSRSLSGTASSTCRPCSRSTKAARWWPQTTPPPRLRRRSTKPRAFWRGAASTCRTSVHVHRAHHASAR